MSDPNCGVPRRRHSIELRDSEAAATALSAEAAAGRIIPLLSTLSDDARDLVIDRIIARWPGR